ncbi:MAG: glycerophosphodiester phosphodiesterase family protein [Clostridia bacterium]|nr:glycerophosphodiester phosphodiesterase family protein [Clostridia bacterium]
MNNPFLELNKKRGVLLAAHRGSCGTNVPCNSREAFQVALNYDADIVELDVENSSDGRLFIQHPGMERIHLRMYDSIRNYPSDFVAQLKLANSDSVPTYNNIMRLEEALDMLKGKAIVNLDKFWRNPDAIAKLVRERGMEDQVLIKCYIKDDQLNDIETYAPDLPFMPMVWTEDDGLERFKNRKMRWVGTECLFRSDKDPIASKEYIEKMHAAGKTVWANSIVYNVKEIIGGGHTDDISVIEDPEKGWGWMADRGFDIIQTDWLFHCDYFLKKTERRR